MRMSLAALAVSVPLAASLPAIDVDPTVDRQAGAAGTGAISGVVREARTGRPLADAIVSLSLLANDAPARRPDVQFTDELGRFVFPDVPAGKS